MRYILLFICGLMITNLAAQNPKPDKIVKKDNTQIEARVIEIMDNQVKYRRFSNLDGPVYSISKSELAVIVYANGETELFGNQLTNTPDPEKKPPTTTGTQLSTQTSYAIPAKTTSSERSESQSYKGLIKYGEFGYCRFGDYTSNIGGLYLGVAYGYRFNRVFSLEGLFGYGTYFPDNQTGQIGITKLNSYYLIPKATTRIYFSKESNSALFISGGYGYAGSSGEFQDYMQKGTPTYKLEGYSGVAYEIGGGLLFGSFAFTADYLATSSFGMVKLGLKYGL